MFHSDLAKAISPAPRGLEVDFIRASSYGSGTESSGQVTITSTLDVAELNGRHVVIVEDIVDTGRTLQKLIDYYLAQGVASVRTAALLDKPERREVAGLTVDYCGFICPNQFVVGYGLDFAEQYRSLPYVGILKEDVYANSLAADYYE